MTQELLKRGKDIKLAVFDVGGDEVRGNRRVTLRVGVANGNSDEFDASADTSGELVAVLQDLVGDL